jgi:hypothetical protein
VGDEQAAARLWVQADLTTPMAVRVVATLRCADHLVAGPRSAPEVAGSLRSPVDVGALGRVLDRLVVAGLLDRDGHGRYSLTAAGEPLRDDHPAGLRARLDIEGPLGRADLSLADLLHSARTGGPAFPERFGADFWTDLAAEPARAAGYDALMAADVAAWAPALLAAYDWGKLDHVIDVGGGNGALAIALLRAHPHLRATVLDQPATAAAARDAFEGAGLRDRADAIAGDLFAPLPGGADAYLLCAVLHDWPDAAAASILRRCAAAAGTSGRVLVVEKTGAGGESPCTEMDLRLLAYFGGRERGVADLGALAATAALRALAVHAAGELSVLELVTA